MKKIALLVLAAPLVLAACGGGSAHVAADPLAYVKQSAHKTAVAPSEHMTMNGNVSAGPMTVTMTGSGDFATATKQGQMALNMSVLGQNVDMQEVLDRTTIYLKSPAFAAHLPSGKTWMKLDLQKAGAAKGLNFSSLMSQSPAQALQRLGAAGSVKSLGTETIDGVDTTHFQITNLDISKLPQGAKIEALAHPKYGPIDVWIGNKDGYVYRESLPVTYSVGGQSASMSMQIDLSKFGEKVNVTVPPANETFDATSLGSGGLGA
jgi:hypothetical protein